jgi:LysR family transcriptional regulator, transcriptional activator of the cysJI operon
MLNLDALNVFRAVAEHGSFSEAGRQMHISQPAVSQIIQGLERQLEAQFFFRNGRTAQLTEAAQVLLPMARELLAYSQRVEQTMLSLQDGVMGEMTIACSTASGKYLLPGLIARFRRQFSQVRLNVIVTSRDSVMNKLLNREVAFGISSKHIPSVELEYMDFFKDSVILIAAASHRWAKYRKVFPDDLLEEPMILREDLAGTREVLMEGLRQHDISPEMLNVAMVLGNAEAIEMAVEEELGIAFVSRLAASRGLELGRIVEIEVDGMELSRNIYFIRNMKQALSRAQIEFWKFIQNGKEIESVNSQEIPAGTLV